MAHKGCVVGYYRSNSDERFYDAYTARKEAAKAAAESKLAEAASIPAPRGTGIIPKAHFYQDPDCVHHNR